MFHATIMFYAEERLFSCVLSEVKVLLLCHHESMADDEDWILLIKRPNAPIIYIEAYI